MNEIYREAAMAMCEKTWDEKTTEERLQTIAHEFAYLWERNQALQERVAKLEQHQHAANGVITVPLEDARNMAEQSYQTPSRIRHVLGMAKR